VRRRERICGIRTFCNSKREMKKKPSDREVISGTYNKAPPPHNDKEDDNFTKKGAKS
jgi:hypothetical protein